MKNKKRALVLTANKFEDMEVYVPVFRLMEEGFEVAVAAPKKEELHGENGYSIMPDKTFDEVDPADYDILVLPGGQPDGAPRTVSKNKKAIEITKFFFAAGKPVASICHGPYTLAAADVIKGRRLTCYWHDGVPEEIKKAGGIYEDKEVVVDRNLITSRWPMDLAAFNRELIKLVRG